jgi:hypothetical protein
MGPALLPGNLKRLRKKAAVDVIGNGRIATQMPAFADKLTPADIEALVEFIYTPSSETITWNLPEINASHIIHNREQDLSKKPVFDWGTIMSPCSTVIDWNRFIVLNHALRCMVVPSIRTPVASFISHRATAGSASTTSIT